MYENLLVELPLAPFFLSKLLGQKHISHFPLIERLSKLLFSHSSRSLVRNTRHCLTLLLLQARHWTLIIWTLWTQNSTEICLLWKPMKGMFRYQLKAMPSHSLSIITGFCGHWLHSGGGGVWSDQNWAAEAWGRFHPSDLREQVGETNCLFHCPIL